MLWARMVAYVTGALNQEFLLRNEYLGAENRILRGPIKGRLLPSELAAVAKPDTLLAWYRKLIANKFDGSRFRQRGGRPRIDEETERLVVQMAKENPNWGYDRIAGALANLGSLLSDQTVGNIPRRHGLSPAPKRKRAISWKEFIRSHMEVLVGTDFFTVEVFTLKAVVTSYVLFFIHLESRRVSLAGITRYPGHEWMEWQARNATMEELGFLRGCRYVLHDRDTKFCASFRELMESGSVKTIRLPARSPNLNSFTERWMRSVKEECLSINRALPADELTPFVEKLADRIASFPAHAIAYAKAAVDIGAFGSMAEGLLVEARESDLSVASDVTQARVTEVLKAGAETYEEMDYLSRFSPLR